MKSILIPALFFSMFLFIHGSCNNPEPPEFKEITNVRASVISKEKVVLNANAVFYNPNDFKVKFKWVDLDVYIDDNKTGKIEQEKKAEVMPMSEFALPLVAELNSKDLTASHLGTIFNVLTKKKIKVRYEGHVKVQALGVGFKVPIKEETEVEIKFK
ncbi:MAG: LEA type 2 family protein [Chitinophagales bacterium]|nr:LEA type 2 family protein [Chitinophagales bacterium]